MDKLLDDIPTLASTSASALDQTDYSGNDAGCCGILSMPLHGP